MGRRFADVERRTSLDDEEALDGASASANPR